MSGKKIVLTVFSVTILILLFLFVKKLLTGGFEKELVPSFNESQVDWREVHGPFIKSQWKQDSVFASFAPENELLGCWSVAFAQVLAYHHLQPSGKVNYVTQKGALIDQEFNTNVNWDRIALSIDSATPIENSSETSKYCFYAAVVVQKDFGIGDYKDISIIPDEVSEHYRCYVNRVDTDLKNIILTELEAGRPVIAYFNDILAIKLVRNGHASVIDGVAEGNGDILVHVNFGWGGKNDGWFNYANLAKERKLYYIFRVMPLSDP
jgi:hypothetical protein